ncbi:hypothetical protein, partial [Klebsiella pneumoniae]|uniref:hypothetical protein n=1 Tax=Klebsiella pneumoniae TaxID=573 RepID=UPI001D0EE62B
IYDSSSAEQARWILADSATKLLVVEKAAHRATITEIESGLAELREVLQLDDGAIDALIARGKDLDDQVVHDL